MDPEHFSDINIVVEQVIWLAAVTESVPHNLEDFLLTEDDETLTSLLGVSFVAAQKRWLESYYETDDDDDDDEAPDIGDNKVIAEYLCDLAREGKHGYLVQMRSPIYRGGPGYSWGWAQLRWFYFDKWDEDVVLAKAKEFHQEMRNNPR